MIPKGLNRLKGNSIFPNIKHYSYRTPKQVIGRAKSRTKDGFATSSEWLLDGKSVFRERFQNYETVKCFNGSFEEYEFTGDHLGNVYDAFLKHAREKFPALRKMDERTQGQLIEKILNEKCIIKK